MSEDFINDLPTELLRQVFDCLFRDEREIAATVCTRWSDIISSGRYIDTLKLEPYHLAEVDVDVLKRFRSISTLNFYGLVSDTIRRLQQFLNNEVVMSNVEELYIAFNCFCWKDIFSSEKVLHYPELRRITFYEFKDDDVMSFSRSKIIAPRLKVLQLIHCPSMWLLSDQIETLIIETYSSLVLPDTKLFPNLRSLTLKHISQVAINDSFKTIVRRLKELKLLQMDNLNFRAVLENICDIESLAISGQLPMSAEVYAVINNMTKLKQLSLLIPIDESARGLSLPCLEKLTLPPFGRPPFENVPSLRSLCIESELYRKVQVNREQMADYYRPFGQQLRHLTLSKLFLDEDLVSLICSFNNLQTLKMFRVEAEFAVIEKIFQSISNLKLFQLQLCIVVTKFIFCENHEDCGCEWCMGIYDPYDSDDNIYIISKSLIKPCFSNLRAKYVDCAIATASSYLAKQAVCRYS